MVELVECVLELKFDKKMFFTSEMSEKFSKTMKASLQDCKMAGMLRPYKDYTVKCHHCESLLSKKVQAGVDVAITTELVTLGNLGESQVIALLAGDRDFEYAIQKVLDKKAQIILFGFKDSIYNEYYKNRKLPVVELDDLWIKKIKACYLPFKVLSAYLDLPPPVKVKES